MEVRSLSIRPHLLGLMEFNELYPDDTYSDDGYVVQVPTYGRCCVCRTVTNWAELSFEAYFCSPICVEAMWCSLWLHNSQGETNVRQTV